MTYFQLGHARSLAAVADKLGESPGTVKNWSSKHGWAERLQAYQARLPRPLPGWTSRQISFSGHRRSRLIILGHLGDALGRAMRK
jgi:hypothetical protein